MIDVAIVFFVIALAVFVSNRVVVGENEIDDPVNQKKQSIDKN